MTTAPRAQDPRDDRAAQGLAPHHTAAGPDILRFETPRCTGVVDGSLEEGAAASLQRLLAQLAPAADAAGASPVDEPIDEPVDELADGTVVHVRIGRPVRLSIRPDTEVEATAAVRRFRRLCEAWRRGLPVVRPLAAGYLRSSPPAEPGLQRAFAVLAPPAGARRLAAIEWDLPLAASLGRLLRAAHDAGMHAPDLRPANLVVDAAGTPLLADGGVLRFAANAPETDERADSLAAFCAHLDGGCDAAAARALLDGYGAWPAVVERARRHARRLALRRLAAAGRAALRGGRDVEATVEDDGSRWLVRRDDARTARVREFAAASQRPSPLREGRRGAVWLLPELVVKQRDAAHGRHLVKAGAWLEFARIPHPQLIAFRSTGRTAWVFSARLAGRDLAARLALPAHAAEALDEVALLAMARDLGTSVGRLHAFGLRNRDLKLDNLVIDPASGRVAMVDLDGVRRRHPLDARGEGRDLGRLLGAWRALGHDHGQRVVRAFWRSYHRARRCTTMQSETGAPSAATTRLRRRIEARAREVAAARRDG
ncbi:MAG: hypothetical protein IPM29_25225 [Planctomycetes bacterium]|nr:hypothetical protein [Planctomycetota bacterium]